jgi:glycosyltransferase A (GT-A) superfamily protein (DUF2064 family)
VSRNDKIALIYFSRSTAVEAEEKSWAAHSTKSQRLSIAHFLNRKTLATLRDTDLDILSFNEHNQIGESFGEKIANAFESAFNQGYTAAISVGNDCLDLNTLDFPKISEGLINGQCYLGPTFRKGAYLIALTKSAFNKDAFSGLNWQTAQLKSDLLHYFSSRKLDLEELETLRDINSISDFSLLLESINISAKLRTKLSNFISFLIKASNFTFTLKSFKKREVFMGLRAPPAAF